MKQEGLKISMEAQHPLFEFLRGVLLVKKNMMESQFGDCIPILPLAALQRGWVEVWASAPCQHRLSQGHQRGMAVPWTHVLASQKTWKG